MTLLVPSAREPQEFKFMLLTVHGVEFSFASGSYLSFPLHVSLVAFDGLSGEVLIEFFRTTTANPESTVTRGSIDGFGNLSSIYLTLEEIAADPIPH